MILARRTHGSQQGESTMNEKLNAAALAAARQRYDAPIYPLLTQAWGGEMIHVGIFDDDEEPLEVGMERSNHYLAEAASLGPDMLVAEVACGVAGVARHLAKTYDCKVRASNIAETQLARARELTEADGLQDKVTVEYGDFHELPYDDGSMDCWWSQESLYHGGDRLRVLTEAYRVLKSGGRLALSDFILDPEISDAARPHIEDVVGGSNMWSYERYRGALDVMGFRLLETFQGFRPVSDTFTRLRARFAGLGDDPVVREAGPEAYDRTLYRLGLWIEEADNHHIGWGYWVAEKP
jgi:sarcosine/dimethylglycine N-methyltransferase